MEDVMLDLETMSTSANAAIVSIGACKFDIDFGITDKFEVVIDLQSCIKREFDIDGNTINWWLKQSDEARKNITKKGVDIKDALIQFHTFLGRENVRIWGNGADFDNAILANAFRKFGNYKPWNYGLNRCFRTIKASFHNIEVEKVGTHHKALDDAMYQATYLLKLVEKYKLNTILQ